MNVLIVDDEFHARKLLGDYVTRTPFLKLIKTCESVFEAMEQMQTENIDLLILDIQMPKMTGMEFARSLKISPIIIFSTAFSDYALESYELDIADYLLKPIEYPRFLKAAYKAKDHYDIKNKNNIDEKPQQGASNQEVSNDFITIKDGPKLHKLNYADLLFIEGQREYVTFQSKGSRITALYTLKTLETLLPRDQFIRVHKSYIVSINQIEMLDGNRIEIADQKIPIGGNYKNKLLDRLNGAR